MNEIDTNKLRRDMMNQIGAAMWSGIPRQMMDLDRVEKASEEELIQLAKKEKMNMKNYRIE